MPKDPYLSPETKRTQKVEVSLTMGEKQNAKRLAKLCKTSVSKMLLPYVISALDQLVQKTSSKNS